MKQTLFLKRFIYSFITIIFLRCETRPGKYLERGRERESESDRGKERGEWEGERGEREGETGRVRAIERGRGSEREREREREGERGRQGRERREREREGRERGREGESEIKREGRRERERERGGIGGLASLTSKPSPSPISNNTLCANVQQSWESWSVTSRSPGTSLTGQTCVHVNTLPSASWIEKNIRTCGYWVSICYDLGRQSKRHKCTHSRIYYMDAIQHIIYIK